MDRAVPALLAALLVLSSAGAAVGLAPPGTTTPSATETVDGIDANSTNVLPLDSMEASGFDRADLVVTANLDAETGALVDTHDRNAIREAVSAAETDAEQRQAVLNATAAAERRAESLLAEERAARMAYANDEIDAESYLATLGRLHARSESLETTVEAIDAVDEQSVATERRAQVQAQLSMLQGPIRAELAAALRGDGRSQRTFVGVSENGLTLATLSGTEFVRETVRFDNRDGDIGRLNFDAAETRFGELYPWASENKRRISMGALGSDVYVVEFTHTHGTIESSLDASTATVFREVQVKSLEATPVQETRWNEAEDVVVGVSKTYPGGPVRVNVTNETGTPIPAEVSVGGAPAGSTGPSGAVWAISPAASYPVRVTTDDTTVEILVDPNRNQLRPADQGTSEG